MCKGYRLPRRGAFNPLESPRRRDAPIRPEPPVRGGCPARGGRPNAAESRCTASHRAAVRLGCVPGAVKPMATPADQRLLELLEKWLKSLELHAKYCSLDDDSYWKIQPWVEHQRPSRWIIDVAKQKTLALKAHVEERVKTGDAKYSDSLELMIFLANLVGSEHIERFIPVAEAQNERPLTPERPHAATRHAETAATVVTATVTATREMPKFLAAKRTAQPTGTEQIARTERKTAVPVKAAARPASKPPARLG